jgi:hypothetical protein
MTARDWQDNGRYRNEQLRSTCRKTWRLALFIVAAGFLLTLVFANWVARQWARSYMGCTAAGGTQDGEARHAGNLARA